VWACLQPEVLGSLPDFLRGMIAPPDGPLPRAWENTDATKLLTAITFAGLGGFWILFYSYWLRDKGAAMAIYNGRITGLITGNAETINTDGTLPQDTEENKTRWRAWIRYLRTESLIGICGNLLTTLMTCLLAYALLFPKGLLPQDYELAVVQARFFEVSWGPGGRILFLLVAAAFLADTWLATVDAVSRMQADIVHVLFPRARRFTQRYWYYLFLFVLTGVTCLTMPLSTPGTLILLSAVIGFAGTVIFPAALYFLNHRLLVRHVPVWAHPSGISGLLLAASFVFYVLLALAYAITLLQ
ncbi:MAG: Nramp family divalent metal transporter, partial [Gammaproteobacteria bacterium]